MSVKLCPNLMVSGIPISLKFYTKVLGFSVSFLIDSERQETKDPHKAVFGLLVHDQAELMLQDKQSLAEELPVFEAQVELNSTSTLYLRGMDPDTVLGRLEKKAVIKGPFKQWYGMKELYFYDPDGYILCVGKQFFD